MEDGAEQTTKSGVLFVDACGSVRLYERLGNDLALERISQYLLFLSGVANEFSGHVVKNIGDELLCVFPDAEHTARAGAQMLARLRAWPLNQQNPISFKIGMHCGEVIHKQGDVFGDAVNMAARMESLASENQLILSGEMFDKLPVELQQQCRLLGPVYVKGKQEPVPIHEMIWNADDAATATVIGTTTNRAWGDRRKLTLRLGQQMLTIDEDNPTATVGRSADNDLVYAGALASRSHLVIEQRGDGFIAIDRSTNATFFSNALDNSAQRLHRDQLSVVGRGWFSLGHPNPEEDMKVYYEVV